MLAASTKNSSPTAFTALDSSSETEQALVRVDRCLE
jgi:hypothetical protein